VTSGILTTSFAWVAIHKNDAIESILDNEDPYKNKV